MMALVAAACAAGATALALPGRPGVDRLPAVVPGGRRGTRARGPLRIVAAAVALSLLVGPAGALLLVCAGVARHVWARDAPARAQRRRVAATLRAAPLAYDLLAACTVAGLTLPVAARVVAASVGEPVSVHLGRLAQALERGVTMAEAVRLLEGSGLDAAGRTLLAVDAGGPGDGAALSALAADGRAAAAAAAQAAAKRSGIWAVGPLTLCFLPAFVLVGVVPVVAGLITDVLH